MSSESARAPQPRAYRAVIADDSQGMRAYLTAIVSSAGYECIHAANGAEAFDAVMAGNIDLVVTDLDMPVMDGFELLAAISLMSPARRRPPVIVVSALMDEDTACVRPEIRLAAARFAKPVEPDILIRAISRVAGLGCWKA